MLSKSRNFENFFSIIISPPSIKLLGAENVWFECNMSELCFARLSSYERVTLGFCVYHVVEDEGVVFGEEWLWHNLNNSKYSRDKIGLVAQEVELVPRFPEPG